MDDFGNAILEVRNHRAVDIDLFPECCYTCSNRVQAICTVDSRPVILPGICDIYSRCLLKKK